MSRLYYPITSTTEAAPGAVQNDAAGFLEKVAKMIPGEILAAYVTLVGIVPSMRNPGWRPYAYLVFFLICLVMTPVYLWMMRDQEGDNRGKPTRVQIIVSTLAFVVWAYAVSASSAIPDYYDPGIASAAMVLFTLFSGIVPVPQNKP